MIRQIRTNPTNPGQPAKSPHRGARSETQPLDMIGSCDDVLRPDIHQNIHGPGKGAGYFLDSGNSPTPVSGCSKPFERVIKPSAVRQQAVNTTKKRIRRPTNREAQMQLGRRIRSVRRARNMTQTELARRVGVSDREVRYWETGVHDPRARLPEIAAALGCTEHDLLDFDGPIPPPKTKPPTDERRRAQTFRDR
jgi:DNA-binding transcriptional regulator YiaG